MMFLQMTTEGHCPSDEDWNCYKGKVTETSERRGWAPMGFFERVDAIWSELNRSAGDKCPLRAGMCTLNILEWREHSAAFVKQ